MSPESTIVWKAAPMEASKPFPAKTYIFPLMPDDHFKQVTCVVRIGLARSWKLGSWFLYDLYFLHIEVG